ncbi:MAG: hypothetical protein KDA45_11705 [Planctomycetales bacterium]|nr:hypothetical protein [Planctomycetales bacterium]
MASPPLVPPNWQLPESFRRRLGSFVGRQRVMAHEGQLLILAHMVPAPGETTRRGILFWYDGNRWQASNGDPAPAAIQLLIDKYIKQLEDYDRQESKAQCSAEYLPLLEGLAPLVRAMRNFYEVLEEARKAAPDRHELIDLRDRGYEAARMAELLHSDAKNSMEVAVVRRAEEQALASHRMGVAAYRLNTMAALFFPLATLGTIFGTTFTENWSWSRTAAPFLLFMIVGLLSGLALAVFVHRPVRDEAPNGPHKL